MILGRDNNLLLRPQVDQLDSFIGCQKNSCQKISCQKKVVKKSVGQKMS